MAATSAIATFTTPVFDIRPAGLEEFVSFWSARYVDPNEPLYMENIGLPLTDERVLALYSWKNGSPLSVVKLRSVQNHFVSRIDETKGLSDQTTAEDFLVRFPSGGAIWRIFWLHCWRPGRFPIYDMHAHRAMVYIQSGVIEEISGLDDRRKIRLYLDRYIPFCDHFAGLDKRSVDRALWTFGKFLRVWLPGPSQALDV